MAREPFLINPPKRRRRAVGKRKSLKGRRVHRPVMYETSKGTWSRSPRSKSVRAGIKVNRVRRRKVAAKRHKRRRNPFGQEVLLMGMNPRRKRRTRSKRARVTRRRKRSRSVNPIRRRRRSYGRRRRSYSRRRRYANPMRRRRSSYRRRHRRNPVEISLKRPASLLIPVAVGIAANIATNKLPTMISDMTGIQNAGLMRYGMKLITAFGGQWAIKQLTKKSDLANVWAIVSLVNLGAELANEYLGLAALPYGTYDVNAPYGGMNAFPGEFAAFPEAVQ